MVVIAPFGTATDAKGGFLVTGEDADKFVFKVSPARNNFFWVSNRPSCLLLQVLCSSIPKLGYIKS
jgi:hypothetical protein